ncbi:pyruvate kinase [Salinibacter ruber]|uniref:Pyruvate kinase n=1 Tax=Salinibacter ruber TaxID=146919 RepID=A0A9X2RAQ4_9BACT|nr:pyruvate kinase [Salinibacter ruber]MCS3858310.1 pyruvate kinase [Salinibacter ruber]MCS3865137.1 pyruvate kinase [Salinibacter ruber]MCS4176148.1 pyruvate kinase [Salinibacter ruber]
MDRRTKIVCTLGPATTDPETLRRLVAAGMDVARMNFSHGTHEEHRERVETVREVAEAEGKGITVLQDLQGPKIRVGAVQNDSVMLAEGDEVRVSTDTPRESTNEHIFIDYEALARDAREGERILIDDGLLELRVIETNGSQLQATVVEGGPLRSRKGVNLPDLQASTPPMTEKDLKDLELGLELEVDVVALSFVQERSDVEALVHRIEETGKKTSVVAKIEKPQAVQNIDEILEVVDGIMVARGDLGIEMPMEEVPGTQKRLIRKSMEAAKPVITATQMLESMVEDPRPTRAEASDVANAVLDGSDAVMLSAETAVGDHPVRVVEAMNQIIRQAESYWHEERRALTMTPDHFEQGANVTNSVSFTACRLAEQVGAEAICCLTNSGSTARSIARHRPSMPIYAFTDNKRVVAQLGSLWGTEAFYIPFQQDTDQGIARVHSVLHDYDLVRSGGHVVLTVGMPLPARGRTNTVHVSTVQ